MTATLVIFCCLLALIGLLLLAAWVIGRCADVGGKWDQE